MTTQVEARTLDAPVRRLVQAGRAERHQLRVPR